MQKLILSFWVGLAAQMAAAAPETPAAGTPLRQDLLNTIRVMAGFDLGPPIEFVVLDLRVDGDRAFAQVMAQRPGGAPIDLATSPMAQRDQVPTDLIDGPRMEAFLVHENGAWYVDAYAIGATDVWWIGPPFCAAYAQLLPDWACD
ncbi:MAG: hypothetical protein AAFQ64_17035 [Pseudomonadota bacterium]